MFHKKLLGKFKNLWPYIVKIVGVKWFALLANLSFTFIITSIVSSSFESTIEVASLGIFLFVTMVVLFIRQVAIRKEAIWVHEVASKVKNTFRHELFEKILLLGPNYHERVNSAELVQVSTEGVEQLEVYVGKYVPQFFYSLIAPLTLFIVVAFLDFRVAIVLFVVVPLIPISIVLVQKFARKLLDKYWGTYTSLGDSFLENVQGLTTLKIYRLENEKLEQMRKEAENFRKITMRVLIMQLNSISVMDIVAYGGSAIGIWLSVKGYQEGVITLQQALFILLISVEFFLPMRMLGSFFHIAMNGNASANRIFKILELDVEKKGEDEFEMGDISLNHVSFSYQEDTPLLSSITMSIPQGSFIGLVGESGSGKSTIASILMQQQSKYQGSILVGNKELKSIDSSSQFKNVCRITHDSFIFKGTIKDNLLLANTSASDEELWSVLRDVELSEFVEEMGGLEYLVTENGSSLSGGQRQRLAIARALLRDASFYIFDEATSNVDKESEEAILRVITKLSKKKTVLFITHRLLTVKNCDNIYVMKRGVIAESGNFETLLKNQGVFADMFAKQSVYEKVGE